MWFLLPWVEIVGRVRKLRFPLRSEVKHRFPPSREVFPDLDEITEEVEKAGFERRMTPAGSGRRPTISSASFTTRKRSCRPPSTWLSRTL